MKQAIHPEYRPVAIKDLSTGVVFLTRSTRFDSTQQIEIDGAEYPLFVVDVTSESHPFWTGTQRNLDTAGRVQKFEAKYGKRTR